MKLSARELFLKIENDISQLPVNEFMLTVSEENILRSDKIKRITQNHIAKMEPAIGLRIQQEFEGWGPIANLMDDQDVSEIIINGPDNILYEKQGTLQFHEDLFFSELSFRNFIERLCNQAQVHISVAHPFADGKVLDFRLSLIGADLTHSHVHLCLRRHPKNPWNFDRLIQNHWCAPEWKLLFQNLIEQKKNCLVVGATGSGKTSVLNSFLNLLPANERVVLIEDTAEIVIPNQASMRLLTREDPHGVLTAIDQSNLVKRALRLRPDRLVMGEVRGAEAKDFLMAMATGHAGSFGTLHAQDAHQALIRLEMLIQMGAPQWNLIAIRRLIQLSLDYIIVVGRAESGQRQLKGLFSLSSLEEQGFLLEQVHI